MKKLQYIIRMSDRPAWRVRFRIGTHPQGNHKVIKERIFSDSHHGDNVKALAAAMSWRDWWAPRLDKPLKTHPNYKKVKPLYPTNNTGVAGVTHVIDERAFRYSPRHFYQVRWRQTIEGKRTPRKRNFKYYGWDDKEKEKAFKEACLFRKEMEKVHYLT